jgi:membrane protease YdiL (CAAX protease family)
MSCFSAPQNTLLVATPLIVLVLIYLFPALTHSLGNPRGLAIALAIYWGVVCFGFGLSIIGPRNLKRLYARPKTALNLALAILPVVPVFFAAFLPVMASLSPRILLLATLFAILNGSAEELFWRGAFIRHFPQDARYAILYPLVLFTAWHIALALIKGAHYQGGALALIGGAGIMGLLWGVLAWRTKSIFLSTLSHIGVNMMAFPAVLLANG